MGGGNERSRSLLILFAPLLAAIQVFTSLEGIISLGQLASWLRDHWRPLAHAFWTWVFDALPGLEIHLTVAEKDSLTAAAFFVPLAVRSILVAGARRRDADVGDDDEDERGRQGVFRSGMIRTAAILLAVGMLFILSRQMISDTLDVLGSAQRSYKISATWSLFASGLLALYAIFVFATFFGRAKIRFWARITRFVTTGVGAIEFLILATPFLLGTYFATEKLGEIRTFSIALVMLSILATIAIAPRALITMAIWVAALVATSFGWDFAMQLKETVDNTGTQ